jgi:hypothetical protein
MVKSEEELMQLNGYRGNVWGYATICWRAFSCLSRMESRGKLALRKYFSPPYLSQAISEESQIVIPCSINFNGILNLYYCWFFY